MIEAPIPRSMPSSYIAPLPQPPPIPIVELRSNAYSYPFLQHLRIAEPIPAAQRNPEHVIDPAARPPAPALARTAEQFDWDSADRDTLLKADLAPPISRVVRRKDSIISRGRRVVPHALQSPEKPLGVFRSIVARQRRSRESSPLACR